MRGRWQFYSVPVSNRRERIRTPAKRNCQYLHSPTINSIIIYNITRKENHTLTSMQWAEWAHWFLHDFCFGHGDALGWKVITNMVCFRQMWLILQLKRAFVERHVHAEDCCHKWRAAVSTWSQIGKICRWIRRLWNTQQTTIVETDCMPGPG